MTVTDLLDAAKTAQGFATDMALAQALGISRSAVSAWRNGVKTPDTVQCAALAGYTGLPLAQVLGIVGEARAISREEKAIWRKLAASAAMLLCAIGLSVGAPGKAYAINVSADSLGANVPSMSIMSRTHHPCAAGNSHPSLYPPRHLCHPSAP